MGRQVGQICLALSILIAGLMIFVEKAHAHGGQNPSHGTGMTPDTAAQQAVAADHADRGHPGHCHGGAFCSGAAVIAAALATPQADILARHQIIVASPSRVFATMAHDPPPPRLSS